MIQKWRSFSGLSGTEKRIVLQSLWLLPIFRLALAFMDFSRLHGILSRRLPVRHDVVAEDQCANAVMFARCVAIAEGNLPFSIRCLPRSVVLWLMLRRSGVGAEVRIGVKKHVEQFEAHAWVEFDGHVINDQPDVRDHFRVFDEAVLAGLPKAGH